MTFFFFFFGAEFSDLLYLQVKIALDWLKGNRVEYRRFAAVLILKVSVISSFS